MFSPLLRLVLTPTLVMTLTSCASPDLYSLATQRAAVEGGEIDENATEVFRVLARVTGFTELCSATLISPQLMLTARHCVAPTDTIDVDCDNDRFGPEIAPSEIKFSNATEPDIFSRWFDAHSILVSGESDKTCGYDIAVVILEQPVPSDVATPATPRFSPPIERGEDYRAVGYGASNADERLAEFGIRHSRDDLRVDCSLGEFCDVNVTGQEFVGSEGACSGDSGGPALDGKGHVIGVLSRGVEGCLSPVYVGVPAFESLLVDAAQQASELVGAPLPVWAGGSDEIASEAPAALSTNVSTPADAGGVASDGDTSASLRSLREESGCALSTHVLADGPGRIGTTWLVGGLALWWLRRRRH